MTHLKHYGAYPMGYMKAFSVICSESTKESIIKFLTVKKEFDEKDTDVKIDGEYPITIYEFKTKFEHSNMLELSTETLCIIDELCKNLHKKEEIKETLITHLSEHMDKDDPNYEYSCKIIDRVIDILVYHYYTRREKMHSPYSKEYLGNRRLYLIYPISVEVLRGLNYTLNKIAFSKKDNILKEQLSVE